MDKVKRLRAEAQRKIKWAQYLNEQAANLNKQADELEQSNG